LGPGAHYDGDVPEDLDAVLLGGQARAKDDKRSQCRSAIIPGGTEVGDRQRRSWNPIAASPQAPGNHPLHDHRSSGRRRWRGHQLGPFRANLPAHLLVDCGQFQGGRRADELNLPPLPPGDSPDAVLLMHAHLNHIGRLPLLVRQGHAIPLLGIYARHHGLFDEKMLQFLREKTLRSDLKTLRNCVTAEESKPINAFPGSGLVLAGSGMCTAGRILLHLKAHLWKPETRVLIVGFRSERSLGCHLINREPTGGFTARPSR